MKAATIHELKTELGRLSPKQIVEVTTRLARFKKENKELLTYLLFEADDESSYVDNVKTFVDEMFDQIRTANNLHQKIKSLRKILRTTNKFIRFSGSKNTEVELLLHYCYKLKETGIPIHRSITLTNLYDSQLRKIRKAASTLHEDLQSDIEQELKSL